MANGADASLRSSDMTSDEWLTQSDLALLDGLARGATVTELAARAGAEERDLYQRLNQIYLRMGVSNRRGALAEATRRGLLDLEAVREASIEHRRDEDERA